MYLGGGIKMKYHWQKRVLSYLWLCLVEMCVCGIAFLLRIINLCLELMSRYIEKRLILILFQVFDKFDWSYILWKSCCVRFLVCRLCCWVWWRASVQSIWGVIFFCSRALLWGGVWGPSTSLYCCQSFFCFFLEGTLDTMSVFCLGLILLIEIWVLFVELSLVCLI